MLDTLSFDSLYYSDFDPSGLYNPVELASVEFMPTDTTLSLAITDADLISRFESAPDTVFNNFENFFRFFYGLYITVDDVGSGGAVSILDLSETELIMYYQSIRDTASRSFSMIIFDGLPSVNLYSYDYTGSRVNEQLDNPVSTDTLMFVSGLSRSATHLEFPEFESWRDSSKILINQALLTVPVEDTLLTDMNSDDYPSGIVLYTEYEKSNRQYILDYMVDGDTKSYYKGKFSESDQAYTFNIGVHLQAYLNGDISSPNLVMAPNQNATNSKTVVLKSPYAAGEKTKLKIIYTKIE